MDAAAELGRNPVSKHQIHTLAIILVCDDHTYIHRPVVGGSVGNLETLGRWDVSEFESSRRSYTNWQFSLQKTPKNPKKQEVVEND